MEEAFASLRAHYRTYDPAGRIQVSDGLAAKRAANPLFFEFSQEYMLHGTAHTVHVNSDTHRMIVLAIDARAQSAASRRVEIAVTLSCEWQAGLSATGLRDEGKGTLGADGHVHIVIPEHKKETDFQLQLSNGTRIGDSVRANATKCLERCLIILTRTAAVGEIVFVPIARAWVGLTGTPECLAKTYQGSVEMKVAVKAEVQSANR
jgi:hypothetical protein